MKLKLTDGQEFVALATKFSGEEVRFIFEDGKPYWIEWDDIVDVVPV